MTQLLHMTVMVKLVIQENIDLLAVIVQLNVIWQHKMQYQLLVVGYLMIHVGQIAKLDMIFNMDGFHLLFSINYLNK